MPSSLSTSGMARGRRAALAVCKAREMNELITLRAGDVTVEVAPWRGALVTALRVAGRDVLYLDRASFDDPTRNVRGGIPLLFPFAGKLADDTFTLTGTTMKQHGFARNRAWSVTARDAVSLRMTLEADDETRAQWPFDFTADHEVMVLPDGVQLALTLVAREQPLPVSPGWHPYFALGGSKAAVRGDAPGLDPARFSDERDFDFGIVAPVDGRSRFALPGTGELAIAASPELRHLQFWSLPGKPFICIEPFFGPAGTINTAERGWVPAGCARTFGLRIRLPA